MYPEILFRLLPDADLQQGIDKSGIRFRRAAGKVVQCRVEGEAVAAAIREAHRDERHHRSTAHSRQPCCRGDGRGRDAEERYEQAVPGTMVLVGCIPYRHVALQTAQHRAQVVPGNCPVVVADTGIAHDAFDDRVLVFPVHDVKRRTQRQQPAADFQRGEMGTQQDHAAALRKRPLQVLQAIQPDQSLQPLWAFPPAHRNFDNADAKCREMLPQQLSLCCCRQLRKAQGDIDCRYPPAAAREQVDGSTQPAPGSELCAIR